MRTNMMFRLALAFAVVGMFVVAPAVKAGDDGKLPPVQKAALNVTPDTTGCSNALNPDTDGDGCSDGMEVKVMDTDPNNPDTDNDKLGDCDEVNKYKTNPTKRDTDNDKLTDYDEIFRVKTNPRNPDTDGDGVIDGDDACPLVPGVKEKKGCPPDPTAPPNPSAPTLPPAKKRLTYKHIYFIVNTGNFNYNKVDSAGKGTMQDLDQLFQYLQQCDEVRVIFEGHTSREGTLKRNLQLSNMRAEAIKTEMIRRGVNPAKIIGTKGYGPQINEVFEPDPLSKAVKKIKKGSKEAAELERTRENNRRITVAIMEDCKDMTK